MNQNLKNRLMNMMSIIELNHYISIMTVMGIDMTAFFNTTTLETMTSNILI